MHMNSNSPAEMYRYMRGKAFSDGSERGQLLVGAEEEFVRGPAEERQREKNNEP